jgi:cobalt-zinc-cadmium resistance protein CzcA
VLSLTVIPVLASLLLKSVAHEEPWLPRQLLRLYEPLLNKAFLHQKVVMAGAGLLLVLAGVLVPASR